MATIVEKDVGFDPDDGAPGFLEAVWEKLHEWSTWGRILLWLCFFWVLIPYGAWKDSRGK